MATTYDDRWGVPVRAGDGAAVLLLDQAIEDLVALAGDPAGGAEAAIAADGELALARIYRAYLSLYATTAEGIAEAGALIKPLEAEAGTRPLPARERHHLAAARAWADGDWRAATRALERALVANPRDLLALKVAQDLYFFLGNRLELRDVAARVLPAWPPSDPAWGFVQGIWAFGLEENGDYRAAEVAAGNALARNPRDVWGVHALAHVFEMEGRHEPGRVLPVLLARLTGNTATSRCTTGGISGCTCSSWAGPLTRSRCTTSRSARRRSTEWLDIVDAAALLWRLSLYGTDVAAPAAALAADISDLVDVPVYLFNDWHAVMTFGLAGDDARVGRIARREQAASTGAASRQAADRAGLRLLEGFAAFAAGEPEARPDRLIDIRPEAHAVGGSHAQRDVIDLTLIAAATRSGQTALTRALVAERTARKPPLHPRPVPWCWPTAATTPGSPGRGRGRGTTALAGLHR